MLTMAVAKMMSREAAIAAVLSSLDSISHSKNNIRNSTEGFSRWIRLLYTQLALARVFSQPRHGHMHREEAWSRQSKSS